jgi:hypothetical protein
MRRRFTRPNIFRQLKRFGVYQGDWKYILIPTAAAYFLPFVFGLWFYYVPLGFPLGLFTFIALLGTFNFLRASKPECWLKNKFDAATDKWADFRPPINEEFGRADWVTGKKGK